jgi:hypothetical protein
MSVAEASQVAEKLRLPEPDLDCRISLKARLKGLKKVKPAF